jgi:hypothetical protein
MDSIFGSESLDSLENYEPTIIEGICRHAMMLACSLLLTVTRKPQASLQLPARWHYLIGINIPRSLLALSISFAEISILCLQ